MDVDSLWVWAGLVRAGWVASMIVGARSARSAPVRTAGGRTLAGIWVGTGVTLTLAGYVGAGTGALAGRGMLGLTAAVGEPSPVTGHEAVPRGGGSGPDPCGLPPLSPPGSPPPP